jgi:hypothetical protein
LDGLTFEARWSASRLGGPPGCPYALAEVMIDVKNHFENKAAFNVRVGNATKELDETEKALGLTTRRSGA